MAALPAGAVGASASSQPEWLLVRSPRPQDFETPVEYLDSYLTPNEVFFVRSHFGPPVIDPKQWRLEFTGQVKTPRTMTMDDLKKFEIVTIPATLQCAGNGRGFFKPAVPGAQWMRGAVGNAEWRGVRLADVLKSLEPSASGANQVALEGYDLPPMPTTPAFTRAIPFERAMDRNTILAFEMNGQPLPVLHGGPLRVVVPGWAGDCWTKWLRRITLREDEPPGFFMQTGYRIPPVPVAPGLKSSQPEVPVSVMPVKSLIARPIEGSAHPLAPITIAGIAFTGAGSVSKVEVSVDGGTSWSQAELEPQKSAGAWQLWRYQWKPTAPGRQVIAARATDSGGAVQPDATPWNHGGYLWNGIDRVTCQVG